MKRYFVKTVLLVLVCMLIIGNAAVLAAETDTPTEPGYRMKGLVEKIQSMKASEIDTAVNKFSDMKKHWGRNAVGKLTQLEIIAGYGNGRFGPDDSLKVNEFIKMLVSAMGFKPEIDKSTDWAKPYIDIALEQGIIKEGDFNGYKRAITREEMIGVLYTAAMKKEPAPDNALDDVIRINIRDISEISNKHIQSVISSYRLGIVRGTPEYFFLPKKTLTRAEGSIVIVNFIDKTSRKPFTKEDNYAIVLNNYARERELVGDEYQDIGKAMTYTVCRPDRKEEMKVANTLKDSLGKSKGYGYVIYDVEDEFIASSFYGNSQKFYENIYETHMGFCINMRDIDIVIYELDIFQADEVKEKHRDVIVEYFKGIFDKDAQKAINEFDKRLNAAIEGNRIEEQWITLNGKPVRFGATGHNRFRLDVWKYKP